MDNTEEQIVSPEEMRANIEIIKGHLPIFKNNFTKFAKQKNGDITSGEIDKIINESLKQGNLSEKGLRIVNSFYETWMAVFMMVGNDKEALEIVFRMLGL
ncbi:hypothetical protein CLPU_8c00180 [Gottschalkia purinilytica]|uniref:Uncharacterized protein n=1 Tax=Gottschalkia purinilytica TaxID=1503 RepID=A0A0L0W9M2_GOTPU|nr:hypothetical protein [Gottschalkia purinilytica]KNF08253.1 hypothetical protein CLPU_8c00180 [Gottschalkia purinilytica]